MATNLIDVARTTSDFSADTQDSSAKDRYLPIAAPDGDAGGLPLSAEAV